ncbi:hypothetical protein [Gynurincola endophyticus]|uniref:hypothetical protein n=1 Tax=Gynurincola endophyticus TaxID=2479004 RepID=UPI0018F3B6C5|nr:hypothetical protein [Gynurincola endophyticus]
MQGISSNALGFGDADHQFKYNSKEEQRKEFSNGSVLSGTITEPECTMRRSVGGIRWIRYRIVC